MMKCLENDKFHLDYFDLIIIDEAHRSIYRKYRAIFAYFDSLLIGLTATPKDEVDRNTYKMFNRGDGNPTFAYESSQAYQDKVLTPPRNVSVELELVRSGITYSDLSEEDRESFDDDFIEAGFDEAEIPQEVAPSSINQWLFNEDTVDKVISYLLEYGLKVEGGERLGKTIIFAKNHKHAMFIQERFSNFVEDGFVRAIDNHISHVQSLIDDFYKADKFPIVAISVDMMDTGIDVPEITNLVFFKVVRSKTKFYQMIGRGTRLCPDLFGPGQDKQFFQIFDFCGNFEFFEEAPQGAPTNSQTSLSKKLFVLRMQIIRALQQSNKHQSLRKSLVELLHSQVANINVANFTARPHRQYVEKYQQREEWQNIDDEKFLHLRDHIADLPVSASYRDDGTTSVEKEETKRFDMLVLSIQLSLVKASAEGAAHIPRLREIMRRLREIVNIPQIKNEIDLIDTCDDEAYWREITPEKLEQIRTRLRLLIPLLEAKARRIVYTDITDAVHQEREVYIADFTGESELREYREKSEKFIRENQHHPAIQKLKHNIPLSTEDLQSLQKMLFSAESLASEQLFKKAYPDLQLGKFIRKLVGLDRESAKKTFARYLEKTEDAHFNSDQIRFIDQIINYLMQNGTMDPGLLYESPFTDFHSEGVEGVFSDTEVDDIIAIINKINDNAGAA